MAFLIFNQENTTGFFSQSLFLRVKKVAKEADHCTLLNLALARGGFFIQHILPLCIITAKHQASFGPANNFESIRLVINSISFPF